MTTKELFLTISVISNLISVVVFVCGNHILAQTAFLAFGWGMLIPACFMED